MCRAAAYARVTSSVARRAAAHFSHFSLDSEDIREDMRIVFRILHLLLVLSLSFALFSSLRYAFGLLQADFRSQVPNKPQSAPDHEELTVENIVRTTNSDYIQVRKVN